MYGQQHFEVSNLMEIQVKQKLGELRFYTEPRMWEVEYLIEAIRLRSLQTCELTGAVGELYLQSQPYFCYCQMLCPEKAKLGFVPSASTRLHPQLPTYPSTRTR